MKTFMQHIAVLGFVFLFLVQFYSSNNIWNPLTNSNDIWRRVQNIGAKIVQTPSTLAMNNGGEGVSI